jgi:hypothetical protein
MFLPLETIRPTFRGLRSTKARARFVKQAFAALKQP